MTEAAQSPWPSSHENEWRRVTDIEILSHSLSELIERHPRLQSIDLIVEAGIGNGRVMPYVAKRLFPEAIYLGTDLVLPAPHYRTSIDDEGLSRLAQANEAGDINESILNANAYDYELVSDILEKTGRSNALLVSCNALFALSDKFGTPWDIKSKPDQVSLREMIRPDSPYQAQLHAYTDEMKPKELRAVPSYDDPDYFSKL